MFVTGRRRANRLHANRLRGRTQHAYSPSLPRSSLSEVQRARRHKKLIGSGTRLNATKSIALGLVAQERLVEKRRQYLVQEEQKLRAKACAAAALSVERHDDFGGELPRDGYIGEAGVHSRCRVLTPRCVEAEFDKRQKLIERFILGRSTRKAAGQVKGAVLNGHAPVKRFDGGNKSALEFAARCVQAKRVGGRAERQLATRSPTWATTSEPCRLISSTQCAIALLIAPAPALVQPLYPGDQRSPSHV